MKQKLLFGIAACLSAAVFVAITVNVNVSVKNSDLSDIALANVEALARGEDGEDCKCGCTGVKSVSSGGTFVYCTCQNSQCCCDNQGCSE